MRSRSTVEMLFCQSQKIYFNLKNIVTSIVHIERSRITVEMLFFTTFITK
jgi:hypothetical protein